jgi:putative ABC transport system permease protein
MKKSLTKFLFRKIKKNISGFITISIIVGLGVGFLVGLLNTTPDLQNSVDAYYNEYKIQDINLKSTIGFDEESINVLKENLGEESYLIESSYQIDEHIYEGENKLSSRQIYYNFDNPDMNIIEIIEGRQPMSEFEIIVERENNKDSTNENFSIFTIYERIKAINV